MSIVSVMPSSHLILCRPLLLLPPIFPSIRVFSNESALCIRCPKYWSFSFNISPSNEHPGLISFRTDCLDLLAVQGTLESLLQYHSSKASILLCSAFFIARLSHPHPYMSTIKEVFSPATTPYTISSELMSRIWAGGLEPRPCHWNNSHRVGLGFWGEVGISPGAPGCPCRHSTLQVWEVGTSPRVPGHPYGQSIFHCPH